MNQKFIDKTFKFSDDIVDPNKYSEYKTENNLVFSRIYPGVVDSILHRIVDNKMITNDGIAIFIEIYSYQKGQGSDETWSTNACKNLTSLKIIDQFQGGA